MSEIPEEAIEVTAEERPEWVARAIGRAEAIHAQVAAETPGVAQEWVDGAVDAWQAVEARKPEVLMDDVLRCVLAAVAPSIAEQARAEERARIVASLRANADRFRRMATDQKTLGDDWSCHAHAFAVEAVADAIEASGEAAVKGDDHAR